MGKTACISRKQLATKVLWFATLCMHMVSLFMNIAIMFLGLEVMLIKSMEKHIPIAFGCLTY